MNIQRDMIGQYSLYIAIFRDIHARRDWFRGGGGGGVKLPVVERPLMMRWIVGSILHGGPIKLFLVPASVMTNKINKQTKQNKTKNKKQNKTKRNETKRNEKQNNKTHKQ